MQIIVNNADLEQFHRCLDAQEPLAPLHGWTLSSVIAAAALLQHELLVQVLHVNGNLFPGSDHEERREAAVVTARRELQAAIGYVTTMVADMILERFEETYGASTIHFEAKIEGDDFVAIKHEINGETKRFLYDRNL